MQDPTSEAAGRPFWEALAAAQAELPMIGADTDGQAGNHKYKYAPLDTIWPKIRETLAKHHLVWSCTPTLNGDTFVMQYALIYAPSSEGVTGFYPLPDGRPQDIGSALTYARRYALCAVLGLVVSGDDDDAHATQTRATTTTKRQPAAVYAGEPGAVYGENPDEAREVAIALINHVQTMDELRAAWTEVGHMGMQKDAAVIAAKDKRKEDLSHDG